MLAAKGLTVPYNIALSVNHPLFIAAYVSEVLPMLVELHDHYWRKAYMRPALAAWLRHHHKLLQRLNLWAPCASIFAERWSDCGQNQARRSRK